MWSLCMWKILVAYPLGGFPLSFKGTHGCVRPSLILVLAVSVRYLLFLGW